MSHDDTTPDTEHTPTDTVQVTVEVPAHRAEQFHRFHRRFLDMAAHWDAQVGNEDLRGRRGRRGRGPHGHGRCGGRRSQDQESAEA